MTLSLRHFHSLGHQQQKQVGSNPRMFICCRKLSIIHCSEDQSERNKSCLLRPSVHFCHKLTQIIKVNWLLFFARSPTQKLRRYPTSIFVLSNSILSLIIFLVQIAEKQLSWKIHAQISPKIVLYSILKILQLLFYFSEK